MQQHGPRASRRKLISGYLTLWAILALGASVVLPSPALATTAPKAITGAAAQVAFASATVTGTVNPNGTAAGYYFEYGTTSAYGMQTSTTSAGAGSADVAVQQQLSGLAASTEYHYRLVVTGAGGPVDGDEETFTTTSIPSPLVTTGTAASIGFSTATLSGSINPQGVPTTYYFEYGTTLAYGSKTVVQSADSGTTARAVTAALTGLSGSTTYHYRLVATSTGGTVVGNDQAFATTKTPAPAVVTSAAGGVTSTSATLNGSVSPAGVSTNYYFQYGSTSGYGHVTATHSAGSGTAATAVSVALTALASGSTYHYRLVAVSAGGTVDGRDMTFATAKTPSPSAVTGPASAVTATTASLTGTIDPHGVATTYYFLYGTKSPTTRTAEVSAGAGSADLAVTVALANLAPGTTYSYRLVAVGAGPVDGETRHFTTAKIPPALSLAASARTASAGGSATFTGMLSGTGVGLRAVALEIERYPYAGGFTIAGATVQTNASGAFTLTLADLNVNTRVRAVTVGGSPSVSSPVTLVQVVARVSVQVRYHGGPARFSGVVAPAGAPIQIEIQRRFRGAWITVARTGTHRTASGVRVYARTIRVTHHARYRVVARVHNGSLLSGRSRVVTLR
jgi:phosphodiesterase/alkaline phosphatase D-like protein